MTASGAQPKSVIERAMPVDSTNCFNAGANAELKSEIIAPMPVNAIAIRKPPSNAFANLTLNTRPSNVKTINIMAAPPSPIKPLNSWLTTSTTIPPLIFEEDYIPLNFFNHTNLLPQMRQKKIHRLCGGLNLCLCFVNRLADCN